MKETDIEELKKKAEDGDIQAIYSLAVAYGIGDGVEQDYQEALGWWLEGAVLGDLWSIYNIGVFCTEGLGTDVNYEGALRDFHKASKKFPKECYQMISYVYHKMAKENLDNSYEWHKKSLEFQMLK